jgi:hypothetical protein
MYYILIVLFVCVFEWEGIVSANINYIYFSGLIFPCCIQNTHKMHNKAENGGFLRVCRAQKVAHKVHTNHTKLPAFSGGSPTPGSADDNPRVPCVVRQP